MCQEEDEEGEAASPPYVTSLLLTPVAFSWQKKKKVTAKQRKILKLARVLGIKNPVLTPKAPPAKDVAQDQDAGKEDPEAKEEDKNRKEEEPAPSQAPPPMMMLSKAFSAKKTTFAAMSMLNGKPVSTREGQGGGCGVGGKGKDEEKKTRKPKKRLSEMSDRERRMCRYRKDWKKNPNKVRRRQYFFMFVAAAANTLLLSLSRRRSSTRSSTITLTWLMA